MSLNGTLDAHHSNGKAPAPAAPADPLENVRALMAALAGRCKALVQGRDAVIDLIVAALFADGHVLLEDHPGSGKTTLAKALGQGIVRDGCDGRIAAFRRIQFTPDLLPSDVTGVTLFEPEGNTFSFRPGPLFANVVLADEINRTSPKVQAALLEAMAEKQVTVDNQTHPLEELFFVIATQNPLDLVGTYPLPKAQLDRFLFKVQMTYLERDSELEVLRQWRSARRTPPRFAVTPRELTEARRTLQEAVHVAPAVHECLVDLAQALRKDDRVALGASTRSLVLAIPALQAWAALHGRDFVSPLDVKTLAAPLFRHRLELVPGEKDPDVVVQECVAPVVEKWTRRTLAR